MRSRWRSGSAVIAGTARAPASSCPRGARAQAPGGKGGSAAEPGQAAPGLEKCFLREIVCERGVAAAEMTEEAANGGTVAFHPEPDRSAGVVGDVAGDEFAVGHGGADGARGGWRSLRPNKVANRAQSSRATPLKPGMALR